METTHCHFIPSTKPPHCRISVANAEAASALGETKATYEKDVQVKEAEQLRRIAMAKSEAVAIMAEKYAQ